MENKTSTSRSFAVLVVFIHCAHAQSYYILATVDLPENDDAMNTLKKIRRVGAEQALCRIRAYDNGTFEMRVCISTKAKKTQTHKHTARILRANGRSRRVSCIRMAQLHCAVWTKIPVCVFSLCVHLSE